MKRIQAAAVLVLAAAGPVLAMPSSGSGGSDPAGGRVRLSMEQGALQEVLQSKGLSSAEAKTRLDRLDPQALQRLANAAARIEEGGSPALIIVAAILLVIVVIVALQEAFII